MSSVQTSENIFLCTNNRPLRSSQEPNQRTAKRNVLLLHTFRLSHLRRQHFLPVPRARHRDPHIPHSLLLLLLARARAQARASGSVPVWFPKHCQFSQIRKRLDLSLWCSMAGAEVKGTWLWKSPVKGAPEGILLHPLFPLPYQSYSSSLLPALASQLKPYLVCTPFLVCPPAFHSGK